MKAFSVIFGVLAVAAGAIGGIITILSVKDAFSTIAASRRCDEFLAILERTPLEDRELFLKRFVEDDPEAAKHLRLTPAGTGVRYIV